MSTVHDLYEKYIAHTVREELISLEKRYVCNVRRSVGKIMRQRKLGRNRHVYLSTKALKHIYDRHIFDKRTPEDFLAILDNLIQIIKYPDRVYRNNPGKSGDFLFAKEIYGRIYLVILEVVSHENETTIEIVSASFTKERYLKKFALLWSGRTATPPS